MAKLKETKETLAAIRAKALRNAKTLGTYNTRSSFKQERNIITFAEKCQTSRQGPL